MCDFPSWRKCRDGSILFLTDKDVVAAKLKFKDSCGHTAIKKFFNNNYKRGVDREGLKNCPPSFLKAIRAGKCQKMMENAETIDFSNANVKGITFPKRIKGNLYLVDCVLNSIVLPEYVGGKLHLAGAKIRNTTLPKSVGFEIIFRGSDLRKVVLPSKVKGNAYFYYCNLSGVRIPNVQGFLILESCNLKDAKIFNRTGSLRLVNCTNVGSRFWRHPNISRDWGE